MGQKSVCFFLPSFAGGGAERIIISIANTFARDGIDVSMCVATDEGPRKQDLSPSIPVTVLGKPRLMFALFSLILHLRNTKPAVVYTTMMHANVIVSMAVFISRIRCQVVLREAVSLEMLRSEVSPMVFYTWLTLIRIFYSRASRVVAVSSAIKQELHEVAKVKPADKVQVIYNAIDANYETLLQSEMVPSQEWMTEVPYVIGIGRFTEQKGFDVLVKALSIANERRSTPFGLVLLGDGDGRTQIEELIEQSRIEYSFLPGYVENPMPFIKNAAAYVLSSRFEGLPNAMIQAMACGTEIISTDCPTGPRELLEGGKWGRLVDVDDVDAMANELASVAVGANINGSPARNVSDALARFDFENMIAEYKKCGQL